jgi:hypothetical protein
MIYVGEKIDVESQAAKDKEGLAERTKNIIIEATGLGELQFYYGKNGKNQMINLKAARGPRVASEILDFLKTWEYFARF